MKTSRMSRLTLPPQVINQDQAPLHQHRRLAILRRTLNDDSLPPRARVAAALVLLYAQPVTCIVRLTVDDVLDDGATVAVRLPDAPVQQAQSRAQGDREGHPYDKGPAAAEHCAGRASVHCPRQHTSDDRDKQGQSN
ncbi:hypothetical protein [Streptomyces sp. NPDC051662]|uniref:hypothetical protein n=1 Tax=Streptomyces sp. NPDC051662 TaxID=3154750 RepID=UPI003414B179